MACYIVTYDLNKETKRPNILKDIKEGFGGWAKLSESSYAISTNLSPDGVYDILSKHLDGNDHIYIITLKKPWQGFGPKTVNDWLNDALTW